MTKNKMTTDRNGAFPIVGIGASAGGLQAYEQFFTAMPSNSGMAFVLVSHLDPTHVSLLPELIQKKTQMTVVQIEDGLKVAPDHVYVIPPNKDLNILNRVLYLMDLPLPRGQNLPIDNFFRSLAQDQGADAICIILSGTGTDGTLGVKEIKAGVGMVMVQEEASAKHDGMPRSAIATGLVDFILPVEKMPDQLIKYTGHARSRADATPSADGTETQQSLQKIFILLRSQTQHDFSRYKKNTVLRRIERRMHVHQIDTIADYITYLSQNDKEVHILFKDLLIGVTSFFRDSNAFKHLKEQLLSRVLNGKPYDYRIRVWVPGCSSGEEAYSIAILLQECMTALGRRFDTQIFGTDIDEDAINTARAGIYPLSIASDIDEQRLTRYFIREDNTYRIKKSIREMVIFAQQSLIKDPPFTKLDLLSCRNLLIYLGPELQKKVFPIFHYSLKDDGLLFLGSSESIGQAADLFEMTDKKWRIFSRKSLLPSPHPVLDFSGPPPVREKAEQPAPSESSREKETDDLKIVETILEQSNMPPCAIIDSNSNIIYIHGHTGRYLEPSMGKVSINILDMARPGLRGALAEIIKKISSHKEEVIQKGIEIQNNGRSVQIDLMAKPLRQYGAMRDKTLIVFKEATPEAEPSPSDIPRKDKALIKAEQELLNTRENLQSTIEELETANEELKSTNEELQSTNEELQSSNEELETSKEEMQSLNEESATVNAELQSRIEELSKTNDDMKNLLDSTRIAAVFLDIDFCVRRFTPAVTRLIPLTDTDIGRAMSHFATIFKAVDLGAYAEKVLNDLTVLEEEVTSADDQTFTIRVLPYRTVQNVIDGVVILFDEITDRVKTRQKLDQYLTLVTKAADAIYLQDMEGSIMSWNNGAEKMYGYSENDAVGMNVSELVPADRSDQVQALRKNLIENGKIHTFSCSRKTRDGSVIDVRGSMTLIKDASGSPEGIATFEREVSVSEKG